MGMDGDSPWESSRERITYEETHRVLEAQKSDIEDMDDKALRTVRVTAVLLGVGVTGVRVIDSADINGVSASLSISSFFLSLLFGVAVYNESDELIGPKATYLNRLRKNDMSAPWESDLLYQITEYVEDNQQIVEFNGYLLLSSQIFFILGVGLGTASLLSLDPVTAGVFGVLLLSVVATVLLIIRSRRSEG